VFVGNTASDTVTEIDARTKKVLATIPVGRAPKSKGSFISPRVSGLRRFPRLLEPCYESLERGIATQRQKQRVFLIPGKARKASIGSAH